MSSAPDLRFDVTIYYNNGQPPEWHGDVSEARARELKVEFPARILRSISRIDVVPRGTETELASDATAEETALTADVVLFGDFEGDLWVLLIERGDDPFKGSWALPGGWVDQGEETEDAAHRELFEETGIRVGYLAPAGVFAAPGRDPRGRFVTFAYVGRMPHRFEPTAGDDAARAEWVRLDDVLSGRRPVAFDHAVIIRSAQRVGIYGQRLNP